MLLNLVTICTDAGSLGDVGKRSVNFVEKLVAIENLIIYNMAQWILNQAALKIINSAFGEIQNTYILNQTCPFKISFDAALVSLLIQLHRLQI